MKVYQSLKVKSFIDEVIKLCKQYELSIGHEDTQGAFLILDYDEENIRWFEQAFDETKGSLKIPK